MRWAGSAYGRRRYRGRSRLSAPAVDCKAFGVKSRNRPRARGEPASRRASPGQSRSPSEFATGYPNHARRRLGLRATGDVQIEIDRGECARSKQYELARAFHGMVPAFTARSHLPASHSALNVVPRPRRCTITEAKLDVRQRSPLRVRRKCSERSRIEWVKWPEVTSSAAWQRDRIVNEIVRLASHSVKILAISIIRRNAGAAGNRLGVLDPRPLRPNLVDFSPTVAIRRDGFAGFVLLECSRSETADYDIVTTRRTINSGRQRRDDCA